jgi:YD repeat-containing protein
VDSMGHSSTFSYGPTGLVLERGDNSSLHVRFGYDSRSNRTSLRDPSGGETRYEYDLSNRLVAETRPNGAVSRFEYDLVGHVSKQLLPDDTAITYSYDRLGRLASAHASDGTYFVYTRDAIGRVLTENSGGHVTSWTYDDNARSETQTDGSLGLTITRQYDRVGRLIQRSTSDGDVTNTTVSGSRRTHAAS